MPNINNQIRFRFILSKPVVLNVGSSKAHYFRWENFCGPPSLNIGISWSFLRQCERIFLRIFEFRETRNRFSSIFEYWLEKIQWFHTRKNFAKQSGSKCETRSTEPLYKNNRIYENNDYYRHFRPKNVNRPPSIGRF